jgi:hypothetical protein
MPYIPCNAHSITAPTPEEHMGNTHCVTSSRNTHTNTGTATTSAMHAYSGPNPVTCIQGNMQGNMLRQDTRPNNSKHTCNMHSTPQTQDTDYHNNASVVLRGFPDVVHTLSCTLITASSPGDTGVTYILSRQQQAHALSHHTTSTLRG